MDIPISSVRLVLTPNKYTELYKTYNENNTLNIKKI